MEKAQKEQPLYMQSYDYAKEHGELDAMLKSHDINLECLREIKRETEIWDRNRDLDIFTNSLAEKYGADRVMYVISRTIQDVSDLHIKPEAKDIAAQFEYHDRGTAHSFTHLYVSGVDPLILGSMLISLDKNRVQTAETDEIVRKVLQTYVENAPLPDEETRQQSFEKILSHVNKMQSLPESCYIYLPTTNEIGIVKKGEKGYYRTDIAGDDPDTNRELVREANQRGGVSKAQAAAMEAGSMFGWHTPASDPKNYDENGKPCSPEEYQVKSEPEEVDGPEEPELMIKPF